MFMILALLAVVLGLMTLGLLALLAGGGVFLVVFGDTLLAVAIIIIIVKHFVKK